MCAWHGQALKLHKSHSSPRKSEHNAMSGAGKKRRSIAASLDQANPDPITSIPSDQSVVWEVRKQQKVIAALPDPVNLNTKDLKSLTPLLQNICVGSTNKDGFIGFEHNAISTSEEDKIQSTANPPNTEKKGAKYPTTKTKWFQQEMQVRVTCDLFYIFFL